MVLSVLSKLPKAMQPIQKKIGISAEDLLTAQRTARGTGSVGPNSVISQIALGKHRPDISAVPIDKSKSTLNFGAGKPNPETGVPPQTQALKDAGYDDISSYDFNIPGSESALTRQHENIFASNVLNVQNSKKMLNTTLNQIDAALSDTGQVIANLPVSPRKGIFKDMSVSEGNEFMLKELNKKFNVEVIGSKTNNKVFKLTKKVVGGSAVVGAGAAQAEEDLNPHIDWDEIATAPEDQIFNHKWNLQDGTALGTVPIPGGQTKEEVEARVDRFLLEEKEQQQKEQDDRTGFWNNVLAPGETLRAGMISLLEGKGLAVTRENIEQVWNDADTKEKSSFMELLDRQFEAIATAPDGTFNPLITFYARNPTLRAGHTVTLGLAADLILDPVNLIGGKLFMEGLQKVGLFVKATDKKVTGGKGQDWLKKRQVSKANKIIERITKRRDELVATENMNPDAAMRVAYNEYDLQHGFLNQIHNINNAGDVAKIDPLLKTIPRYPGTFSIKEGKLVHDYRKRVIVNSYNKTRETNKLRTYTNDIWKGTKNRFFTKGVDKWITPVLTRLHDLSPKLADRMVRLEYETAKSMKVDLDNVNVWLGQFRELPKEVQVRLTQHLNNKNFDGARELMRQRNPSMATEFDAKIVPMLDEKFRLLEETGTIRYQENYFPRQVNEHSALHKAMKEVEEGGTADAVEMMSGLRQKIQTKEQLIGRKLSDTEVAEMANSWFLQPQNNKVVRKLDFEKRRIIDEIDGDLIKHYDTADHALTAYITKVNHQTQIRKFLGKRVDGTNLADDEIVKDSIGNIVAKLERDGDLRAGSSNEIKELLQARFVGGEKGSDWLVQKARDFGYMTTLGNPHSAMTQLGDIGTSMYLHGVWNTGVAIVKQLAGKNPVRYENFGTDVMAELTHQGAVNNFSRQALDFSLRKGGFRAIDMLGKNANINASINKWSKMSNSPKMESAFRARFKNSFNDIELDMLVNDFKNFKQSGTVTDNMNYVTFNELLDAQPIALSSLPEKYLSIPNGRLLYQLKTFALKQVDLVRKTIGRKASQGDYVGATADAMRYTAIVGGANATSTALKDLVKDVLSGDKEALDTFNENLENDPLLVKEIAKNTIKVMGFDPETIHYQGIVDLTPVGITVPGDIAINVGTGVATGDLDKVVDPLKYVPIVGRWLHYVIDNPESGGGFDFSGDAGGFDFSGSSGGFKF